MGPRWWWWGPQEPRRRRGGGVNPDAHRPGPARRRMPRRGAARPRGGWERATRGGRLRKRPTRHRGVSFAIVLGEKSSGLLPPAGVFILYDEHIVTHHEWGYPVDNLGAVLLFKVSYLRFQKNGPRIPKEIVCEYVVMYPSCYPWSCHSTYPPFIQFRYIFSVKALHFLQWPCGCSCSSCISFSALRYSAESPPVVWNIWTPLMPCASS